MDRPFCKEFFQPDPLRFQDSARNQGDSHLRVPPCDGRFAWCRARERRAHAFVGKASDILARIPVSLHSAIIVILLGGLLGLIYGTRGHVLIKEGDSSGEFELSSGETRTLPFQIAVDKFSLSPLPNWRAQGIQKRRATARKRQRSAGRSIRVNHPLTFKGISIYQSDYRVVGLKEVKLDVAVSPDKKSELEVQPTTTKKIPELSTRSDYSASTRSYEQRSRCGNCRRRPWKREPHAGPL